LSKEGATQLYDCCDEVREPSANIRIADYSESGAMATKHGRGITESTAESDLSATESMTISLDRPKQPTKPVWDRAHRELRFNGMLVKCYRVPAPNQTIILDAFQEDDWPEFIDDPIRPEPGIDPKERLKVTIKSLNRTQVNSLIRFHGNGNGLQVYWASAAPA
jgi:hypothetical protein